MFYLSLVVLGGLALVFSLVINLASRRLSVEEDPLVEAIENVLPGTNCGACGLAGCRAAAKMIAAGKAENNICLAGGPEVTGQVAAILGVEPGAARARKAVVHCQGDREMSGERFVYRGVESCLAANLVAGGPKACTYGCLGFGDCVHACPFDAIRVNERGLAEVDETACTGCGKCVAACARGLITLLPRERKTWVGCMSRDRGRAVRNACKVGCIACGICVKVSPEGAVTMEDNLPRLHFSVTDDFSAAAQKCPMKCFVTRRVETAE